MDEKKCKLAEQVKHYLSYKKLISRNQAQEQRELVNKDKILHLPFILVSTEDCPENEVYLKILIIIGGYNLCRKLDNAQYCNEEASQMFWRHRHINVTAYV